MADQNSYSGLINIKDVDDFTTHTVLSTVTAIWVRASGNKKFTGQGLADAVIVAGNIGALTELTAGQVDSAADKVLIRDESTGLNKYVLVSSLAGGGSSKYDAGNGCYVRATGTGCTFVRTSSSVWTLTVPDGVDLETFDINSTDAESATSALDIKVVFQGTRTFNQSLTHTDLHAPFLTTVKKTSPLQYPTTVAGNFPAWTVAVLVAGTLTLSTTEFSEVGGSGAQATFVKGVF
mgnify:CR=1 FL=1